MNFSEVIKRRLKEVDMNASELARSVGHSPQYVHELLRGTRRWNEANMSKACNALGLEIKIAEREEQSLTKNGASRL